MVAHIRAAVPARSQTCDLGAHSPLGIIEQVRKEPNGLLIAEVERERSQPLGAYSRRPEHGVKITREQVRTAGIGEQQAHDIRAQDAAFGDAQRGNSNALMKDFPSTRIVCARHATTDVGLVGAIA